MIWLDFLRFTKRCIVTRSPRGTKFTSLDSVYANMAWLPICHALMTDIDEAIYKDLYVNLEMTLLSHPRGPIIQNRPLEVMMDFEVVQQKPWLEKFPKSYC